MLLNVTFFQWFPALFLHVLVFFLLWQNHVDSEPVNQNFMAEVFEGQGFSLKWFVHRCNNRCLVFVCAEVRMKWVCVCVRMRETAQLSNPLHLLLSITVYYMNLG